MAYAVIPARSASDLSAYQDVNQLQDNFDTFITGVITSGQFEMDAATGFFGVGVTPTSPIHAQKATAGILAQIRSIGGTNNPVLRVDSSEDDDGWIDFIETGSVNGGFRWFTAGSRRVTLDKLGNLVVANAALSTAATDGFLYVPSCGGLPTGTPTTYTGMIPLVFDTTNDKIMFYEGGAWKGVAVTI